MSNLKANIINETEKLFYKKKVIIFLVFMAVISFLCGFFISSIQSKLIFISFSSMSYSLIILSIITDVFLPLFIFLLTAEAFSSEIEHRTLKLVLTRPISRFKIYLSKIVSIALYIAIALLLILIISIITTLLLKLNMGSISKIIFSYIIDIIPGVILATFSAFICNFFKSSNGSLTSCILIFIIIKVIPLLISGFNNIAFTSYLNWHSQWIAGGVRLFTNINLLFMLLAYGIIFLTMGFYLFDKKQL